MLVRGDPPDRGWPVLHASVPPASDPCWTARVGILAALLRKRGPLPTVELLQALPWGPMVSRQVLAAADGEVAWFRAGLWSAEPSRKPTEPGT